MSIPSPFSQSARVLAAVGLALCCVVGCKKPPRQAPVAKPTSAVVNTNLPAAITNNVALAYVSVFEDLPSPQGKDPFFPKSHRRDPAPPPGTPPPKPPVEVQLFLKGIVGSANRRFVVINNATLAVGEESSVRVPDGHVRVKCLEIGEDYAVVKVDGEAQPKTLVLGKKR